MATQSPAPLRIETLATRVKAPPSLESLPSEIWNAIIESIDVETFHGWAALSKLRGANKNLAALVTPKVFECVPGWLSIEALSNLNRIASHEKL